jgi:hypothetical protein
MEVGCGFLQVKDDGECLNLKELNLKSSLLNCIQYITVINILLINIY